ncbi:toxin-antitoxin system YwqK family antitoxin [Mucilaginibacter ginkgonis]|uniref:MORN repeat protein n=1 Tax=Mucilaginibacter ginkgonis TaxID=2682091 RepID=A0A6I4I3J9_9SPHI|nr:hypothetical protein [Mucilaginibacter ginkgonis]QQL48621.1 hypothetical protein GO620_010540 [Mucilaginibacter ginkgonis]
MKKLFTILLTASCTAVLAQTEPPTAHRMVRYRTIGRDSINLSLNSNYELIEDSCADIVRYAHANLRERKFKGAFKDLNKNKPTAVLSEGTYTDEGLKTGLFLSRYDNGSLQSKGYFKNNQFDGNWTLFYENDKPKMDFDAVEGKIKINNYWDARGKKTVDNGKGVYSNEMDYITWKGKLNNGLPDGTWHAYRTADVTETSLVTESYKNGVFQKGSSPAGDYTDGSRIVLISESMLPYLKAEKFQISTTACNGTGFKKIVHAQYRNGAEDFNEAIKSAIEPYLKTVDIKSYDNQFVISGEISERGQLTKLTCNNAFNQEIANGFIRQLYHLPLLVPATANGVPVKEGFDITFTFERGFYSFRYHFQPIKQTL